MRSILRKLISKCPEGSVEIVVSATKITHDKMKPFSRIAKVENQRFWSCLAKGMQHEIEGNQDKQPSHEVRRYVGFQVVIPWIPLLPPSILPPLGSPLIKAA